MNTRSTFLPLLLGVALSTTAVAQTPAPKKPVSADATRIDFTTLDKDANGSLSKEEAVAIADLEARFDQLDADRSTTVSPAEYAAWSRAGKTVNAPPRDPATAPGGSAGAQHLPERN
jgi:hypothetical protein